MEKIAWLTLSEGFGEDGWYLAGEAAFEPERAELKRQGAPATETIEFVLSEPAGRGDTRVEALVEPAFAEWARANLVTCSC